MRTQGATRRFGWATAGAAMSLLLAACSTMVEETAAPAEPGAVGAPAEPGAVGSLGGLGGLGGIGETTEPASRPEPPSGNDTIIVTGTRLRRDDFTSPSATMVVTAEDMRNLGVGSVAEMLEQLPANVRAQQGQQSGQAGGRGGRGGGAGSAAPAPGPGAALAGQIRERELADGTNERSPLSRVSPGEELWIISQPQADAATTADVPEDALGSGVMVARFLPAVTSDPDLPPAPVREIPLPLKHTNVEALVQGYVGTVDVTQQFENPYDAKIEAVYLFPLPEKAAISEFVMTIGDRSIRGILREKEEAQEIYRQARAQGYRASLLTQHRPNVFEQKVANIEPGRQIDINIRYYETLAYHDGWYSFVFPTVVGPRYNPPGSADPLLAVPQTNYATTPGAAVRYLTPGTRSAHDLSISVEIDAGVGIEEIESSHALSETRIDENVVRVELADGAVLPNKDFLLSFRVAGERIKSNLLTYVDEESGQGYFTLMMYPPSDLENLRRQPLELVFVLDSSGSMSGAPIEQAKAAIVAALDRLGPGDTFQIIRFSQNASQFGAAPVAATPDNIQAARRYVRQLSGSGGTQMIEGIRAALGFPHDEERLRFVTFLTDGFIGNETEILDALDSGLGASRIFSFGVGSAPNRYLLERMAGIGRGAVAYLSLQDSGRVVMNGFFDRIAHPAMIDVEIDWGRMRVADVYPIRLPDLFVGRPVIVTGRFEGEPNDLRLTGRAARERVRVDMAYEPDAPKHEFLPNIWARIRIAELNDRLAVEPASAEILGTEIRNTALAYSLMSDYTSFIAVDASEITAGTSGTTIYQGVPVPEGVRYDTTVGR